MLKIDNYELETLLGKGAFGEVYLTTRAGDDKKYATKVFLRDEIEKTEAKRYLENEIIILKTLNHPNICKFQDVKKSKKHFYVMMEYCNGGELSKALTKYMEKNGRAFPEELVQHFMRQIIDAFQYIHGQKIIHRDVKLDNILLHYENEEDKKNFNLMKAQVKIIDFGFSCMISPGGLRYTCLGSPINMDPIILKKLNHNSKATRQLGYNESADIWSIGTVCYEMLIGKSAFDAEDMTELVSKVENGSYTIPTNISYELVSFMNGMLQYTASKRLTAAQLFRHDFLTKDVSQFKKIDLEKVSDKVSSGVIDMNSVKNSTIWSIFNEKSETLLTTILGNAFVKPVDKKEEKNFAAENEKPSLLQLPSKGIPENPINTNVSGMSEDEVKKMEAGQQGAVKETNYVFNGSIFDF